MKVKLTPRFTAKIRQSKYSFSRVVIKQLKLCKRPRFWLAIALFSLALLCTIGPLKVVLDRDILITHILADPCCQAILFILLFVFLTIIGIPGTVFVIAGGIVFGLFWGTLWSVIGATLGALAAFWTARYLFRDCTESKFSKNKILAKFKQAVVRKPFSFVFVIRLIPISPFNLENYLFALTPIHWFPYTFATLLGIIPGTIAYTWLGVTGNEALRGGDLLPFFLALAFLVLLSVLPICLSKKKSI